MENNIKAEAEMKQQIENANDGLLSLQKECNKYQLENERLREALGECRDLFFYMEGNDFNDFKLSVSEQLKKVQKLLFEHKQALADFEGETNT